MQSNKVF